MSSPKPLSLRLLGPLEVVRGQGRVELPPSKKTRALLAYLVVSKRSHRRERLSSLFWDVADDPKAALRWSLSKLRPLLDDKGVTRILADRDTVRFEPAGADVDVFEVERMAKSQLEDLGAEELEALLRRFRGPFIEGLELDDFAEFQAWCVAERQRFRSLHERLLRALIDRTIKDPEAALTPARKLVQLCPADEAARASLVRLLYLTGRRDEAQEHHRMGLRELERSGAGNTGRLASTWRSLVAPAVASARGPDGPPPVEAPRQEIRFCTAGDGARIAYATLGTGKALVKAANWLTHLEYDHKSPIWRHLTRDLSSSYQLVRYDQRGNGLSDWQVEISFEGFLSDLEATVDAVGLERFALLGISQGSRTAVAYAVRHPERVSHLVLYGGSARGWRRRSPQAVERREALATLMRQGWGSDNPAFRQLFTNLFMPEATAEQVAWFNELQQVSCSPENAVRITEAGSETDVTDLLERVQTPTLVMHATRDAVVPFEEARILAAGIPDARFVALDSPNHLLLGDEPAWRRFVVELRAFLG